jgi:tetratricopeptide (TPR) repeat protein
MKRYFPLVFLLIAMVCLSLTGFQCGSAETTSAKLYFTQKQYQKAEESLLKQVAKNPKDEEAWFLLGQTRHEMQNYSGMNDAFQQALAVNNSHRDEIVRYRLAVWAQMYNTGVNAYNKGRDSAAYYDKALDNFRTAISMEPDSSGTYYVAALAYYAKHDTKGAQQMLETALQKRADFSDAARFLGQIYFGSAQEKLGAKDSLGARTDFSKSASAFETAYKAEPDSPENITNLIEAYELTNQTAKAEALTKNAVQKDPKNKLFRYAYGVFLLKNEEYPDAIEQFSKALEIDPAYSDAKYNLGVSYLNWGVTLRTEANKKLEQGKKGSKLTKEETTYMEKFKQALPYLEESGRQRPDDAALWTQLGRLYTILNMPDKAKAAYEKSDKLAKP